MLCSIKPLHLQCVFHGIRFKVNNEDWLFVMDSLFFVLRKRKKERKYLLFKYFLSFYLYQNACPLFFFFHSSSY